MVELCMLDPTGTLWVCFEFYETWKECGEVLRTLVMAPEWSGHCR